MLEALKAEVFKANMELPNVDWLYLLGVMLVELTVRKISWSLSPVVLTMNP